MNATHPPASGPAEAKAFAAAFDGWWIAPSAETFPYASALRAYRESGKHFVPPVVTWRMRALRAGAARVSGPIEAQGLLGAFLDTALDKHEGRYDYTSYCALPVLGLPGRDMAGLDGAQVLARRDRWLVGLIAGLMEAELAVLDGTADFLPLHRPDHALARRRLDLALTALRPALRRLGHDAIDGAPEAGARAVCTRLPEWLDAKARARIDLSLLPVHAVHDEVMFLRILQAFELTFAWVAVLLRGAIADLPAAPASALDRLRHATGLQREMMRLFPLIGAMQVAAFHEFRRYTEGASAIQSVGYKTVESLCRRPDPARLASAAYAAMPGLRQSIEAGQPTLDGAFDTACRAGRLTDTERESLADEMAALETGLLRWRAAHYELARRFLGDRGGTGYTAGVPYLAEVRHLPVFGSGPGQGG